MIPAIRALPLVLLLLSPAALAAEEGKAEGYGGGSFVVTPVSDCFAEIPPADAVTIRRDYANPYSECLRRLQAQKEKAAKAKAAAKKKKADKKETPDEDKNTETTP